MNHVQSKAILPVTASLYLLVALAASKLTDSSFAIVLIVIVVSRLLFLLVDAMGSGVAWRLDGRKSAIESALAVLRTNDYPKRYFAHDDFPSYLIRIEGATDASMQLKASAREWARSLAFFATLGALIGMRMQSVAEAALEIHSPRSEASTIASLSKPPSKQTD